MTRSNTLFIAAAKFFNQRPWLIVGAVGVVLAAVAVIWAVVFRPTALPEPSGHAVVEAPPEGPPWFRDVTAESGVDFTYRNGEEANQYTILESLGGGAGHD